MLFFNLLVFCEAASESAENDLSGLEGSLLGALRSPSTIFEEVDDLDFFFLTSSSSEAAAMFSSSTRSEDAGLDDAFVVRVDLVDRVGFLTGMLGNERKLNAVRKDCLGICVGIDAMPGPKVDVAMLVRDGCLLLHQDGRYEGATSKGWMADVKMVDAKRAYRP